MDKNILMRIEQMASSFSKGQARIARYILADLPKAALLTASALGKQTQVSESTVVRFATELGYDGFPQMQKAMQEAFLCSFEANPEMLQKDTVDTATQVLRKARRIYLVGQGFDNVLVSYMRTCLEMQFPDVHMLGEDSGKVAHIGAEDVAVFFAFSAQNEKLAGICRDAGAKVIALVESERSNLCRYCDVCLFANAEEKPYGLSLTKPMALVEQLLSALTTAKESNTYEV